MGGPIIKNELKTKNKIVFLKKYNLKTMLNKNRCSRTFPNVFQHANIKIILKFINFTYKMLFSITNAALNH